MKAQDKKVIDENGNEHIYNEEKDLLGEGGQGAVYRTKDGDVALKIDNSNESLGAFKKKIEEVVYKPLLHLDIIKPLVLLQGKKGYVMRLLDNFKPLLALTPDGARADEFSSENIPFFLREMFESKSSHIWACKIAHYKNSGGLRKRLVILKRVACILSNLHLKGMVYCDLSPNNIFISEGEKPLVKFIDADNIEYQSIIKSRIYTPKYEVPEIAAHNGNSNSNSNSMYSDIYAFGILAFYLLSMVYPFVEIESDWDNENDAEIKNIWDGEWIDSEHFSGEYNEGLRGILSTEPLRALFSATFESGKLKPHQRPIMPLWIEAIEMALNNTLQCPKCAMSYYDSFFDICPYCDKPKPLRVIVEGDRKKFVRELDSITDSCIEVPLSLIEPININSNMQEILFSLEKKEDNLILDTNGKTININGKKIFSKYKRPLKEFHNMKIEFNGHTLMIRIEQ